MREFLLCQIVFVDSQSASEGDGVCLCDLRLRVVSQCQSGGGHPGQLDLFLDQSGGLKFIGAVANPTGAIEFLNALTDCAPQNFIASRNLE